MWEERTRLLVHEQGDGVADDVAAAVTARGGGVFVHEGTLRVTRAVWREHGAAKRGITT